MGGGLRLAESHLRLSRTARFDCHPLMVIGFCDCPGEKPSGRIAGLDAERLPIALMQYL
jgi:hypothetical protein